MAAGCPICSKPIDATYQPFCSKRCADVDLNRWLKGTYAIPGAPADEEEDGAASPPEQGGAEPSRKH
jgi:endogenous inhibitor of DNA gyrase (YacG/DUF329 family)